MSAAEEHELRVYNMPLVRIPLPKPLRGEHDATLNLIECEHDLTHGYNSIIAERWVRRTAYHIDPWRPHMVKSEAQMIKEWSNFIKDKGIKYVMETTELAKWRAAGMTSAVVGYCLMRTLNDRPLEYSAHMHILRLMRLLDHQESGAPVMNHERSLSWFIPNSGHGPIIWTHDSSARIRKGSKPACQYEHIQWIPGKRLSLPEGFFLMHNYHNEVCMDYAAKLAPLQEPSIHYLNPAEAIDGRRDVKYQDAIRRVVDDANRNGR